MPNVGTEIPGLDELISSESKHQHYGMYKVHYQVYQVCWGSISSCGVGKRKSWLWRRI